MNLHKTTRSKVKMSLFDNLSLAFAIACFIMAGVILAYLLTNWK